MKKILMVAGGLLLILLLVTTILLLRLDADEIALAVIEQVESSSGIQLTAESASLHPLKGFLLVNATATGTLPSGQVRARVDLLKMRVRIWPLVRGEVVIDRVSMQHPVVELISRDPATRTPTSRAAKTKAERRARRKQKRAEKAAALLDARSVEVTRVPALQLSIRRLEVEDGRFDARTAGREKADLTIEEISLVLDDLIFKTGASSNTSAISGSGTFASGRLLQGDFDALEIRGDIRLGEGVAELSNLEIRSTHANLEAEKLVVYLEEEPPKYSLSAAGGVDLNGVVGFEGSGGFGKVTLELLATGDGPDLAMILGEGRVTMEAGAIPPLPAISDIEELLGQPFLTGRSYEATSISYRLLGSALHIEPFELRGDGASILGSGVVDLGGALDLLVSVRIPREKFESVGVTGEVLATLTDENGWILIPLEVGGTLESPRVNLAVGTLRDQIEQSDGDWVERVLEEAKEKAGDWLKEHLEGEADG